MVILAIWEEIRPTFAMYWDTVSHIDQYMADMAQHMHQNMDADAPTHNQYIELCTTLTAPSVNPFY